MSNYINDAKKARAQKLLDRAIESGNKKEITKMRERLNAFKSEKKIVVKTEK